jgi:signal peptidase II
VSQFVSSAPQGDAQASPANPWLFWSVLAVVVVVDVVTKALAVSTLMPAYTPHDIVGDLLRLTLVYNKGAAFGIHVGDFSRWFFMALSVVALGIMGWMYRATRDGDYLRVFALGLVCAGAIGNLIDRIRSSMGVVDFIDVGIGVHRWPTFNVADIGVSCGAVLLAIVMFREDREAARAAAARSVAAEQR